MSGFSSDHLVVQQLIDGDEAAWLVIIDAAEVYFRNERRRAFFADYGLCVDDLISEAYVYLTEYQCRRLRQFRFEQSFSSFLFTTFRACQKRLLSRLVKKRATELSDESLLMAQMDQTTESMEARQHRLDCRETLKEAFALLWERNPQRAWIYLLREKLEMPSSEVAALLGLTANNVDAALCRTKKELKSHIGTLDDERNLCTTY